MVRKLLEKLKAAVYGRISDFGQLGGTSLETQVLACLEEARKLGLEVAPEHIWREVCSGAFLERPVLPLVRAAARSRAFDVLIVYVADRLSRNPTHLLMLMDEFADHGVRVIFVQGVSDDTPDGRLLTYIVGYTSERERAQIMERTMRGKKAVARSGRMPNGTGAGLFGYDYDVVRKERTVNWEEAAVVRKMFNWAMEGVAVYQIACRLNEEGILTKKGSKWHAIGVRRILQNPAFTGVQSYGKNRYRKVSGNKRVVTPRPPEEVITLEGFSPVIISQEIFDRVQQVLQVGQAKVGGVKNRYLLTGFTRCVSCGGAVVGACLSQKFRYYRCRNTTPTPIRAATCQERYIRADDLEEVVWGEVCRVLRDPGIVIAELKDHLETGGGDLGQAMKGLEKEVRDLKGQQRRLMELWQKDMIDMELLEGQIAPLKTLCEEKEQELRVLEEQQRGRDDAAELESRIIGLCQQFSDKLDQMDFDGKRATLAAFSAKVNASREELSITMVADPKFTSIVRTWA